MQIVFLVFFSISLLFSTASASTRAIHVEMKDSAKSKPAQTTLYEGSYALLVGVGEYKNGWPRLEGIKHELDRVEQLLRSKGFEVKRVNDPDSRGLENAFKDFIDDFGYTRSNRLLFFYSGHGHTRKNGTKGYLVPVDAPDPDRDEQGFLRKALPMTQILAWSRNIEAKHALFLFDSCFSGTVFKQKSRPNPSKFITRLAGEPVRQFITAGSAGEAVPSESTFTPAFVDALQYGLGDLNQDGYVSGTELGLYLQEEVPKHIDQTPQYGKIADYKLSRGDFIFLAGGSMVVEQEALEMAQERQQKKKNKTTWLKVTSEPSGAMLYVDGNKRGTTPVTLDNVVSGRVLLRVVKEGYVTEKKQVTTKPGRTVSVGFVLSAEKKIKKSGWLTISPDPSGARVRILNIAQRYRPGMELEPGRYQVEVLREGYETTTRWLTLSAGEDMDVAIHLEPVLVKGPEAGDTFTDPVTGMEFVWVEGGCFQMGDTFGDGFDNQKPVHEVCVDGFYIGKYEVTQGEWQKIMSSNPSRFAMGDNYPVDKVSWHDARNFISKLNSRSGKTFRMPTEAQWEYAARSGGKIEKYAGGISIDSVAWYDSNSGDSTHRVGTKSANGLGIYDMSGNVWEWCSDWYDSGYYSSGPRTNPQGPSSGSNRAIRGGGWYNNPRGVRAADRYGYGPGYADGDLGLRLQLT